METLFQQKYEGLLEAYSDLRIEFKELMQQLDYLSAENTRLKAMVRVDQGKPSIGSLSRDKEIEALKREITRMKFQLHRYQTGNNPLLTV